jgi:hypothetical protein
MIVIGTDVHKSTHALAAVDPAMGQLLGEREIGTREQGTSKRCVGHTSSARRSCGRLRTVATFRTISSRRLSPLLTE